MASETKVVEVVGIPSGDCECWCLEVTEAEYRRVMGAKEHREAVAERKRFGVTSPRWLLYPDDLMALAGVGINEDRPVRLTLTVAAIDRAADGEV